MSLARSSGSGGVTVVDDEAVGEEGFTLIELMVVVLIIAILLAIAIPAYRGAMQRAGERRAQTHLRNAALTGKLITNDLGFYMNDTDAALTVADMRAAEGSLEFSTDPTQASTRTVIMIIDDDPLDSTGRPNTRLHLYLVSEPGRWFGITTTTRGKFRFCEGNGASFVEDPNLCLADKW